MAKDKERFALTIFDLAVLMANVYKAEADPRLSGCSAQQDFRENMKACAKRYMLDQETLESCLWACNMLDEIGEFFHPEKKDFDYFLNRIGLTKQHKYDKLYNKIERKRNG